MISRWEPNLLKYFKSNGYNVMWWGKNDLLAADAWETSVTSAMTVAGRNYGSNPYHLLTEPEYYYRCIRPKFKAVTQTVPKVTTVEMRLPKEPKNDLPFP